MKKILMLSLLTIFMLGSVMAASSKVSGDISLTWSNAYDRPQLFVGTATGGLAGSITLTTNTDYDATATHVGTTWSDDVILTLIDTTCSGFYAGANVNAGRNAGTFTLSCENGNIIQGMMHGVNDAVGNMNLQYSGLIIEPLTGPKGDKGYTGETGSAGTCTCDSQNVTDLQTILAQARNYNGFSGFFSWINNYCTSGTKCTGNRMQSCQNFQWNYGKDCQYGCSNGVCNQPTKEDCTIKPTTAVCSSSRTNSQVTSYKCAIGQGTDTSCITGNCLQSNHGIYCYNGCDKVTGKCK